MDESISKCSVKNSSKTNCNSKKKVFKKIAIIAVSSFGAGREKKIKIKSNNMQKRGAI